MMEPARLNLPPARLLPPRATARMASSSKFRPMLLVSALVMREEATTPAMPAHRPHST